jgi:hypothetical protein
VGKVKSCRDLPSPPLSAFFGNFSAHDRIEIGFAPLLTGAAFPSDETSFTAWEMSKSSAESQLFPQKKPAQGGQRRGLHG